MAMLSPATLPSLQAALGEAGLDGWLLYDFHGTNPVAAGVLGLEGMVTRRVFAFVPREGAPTAITHAIEQAAWRAWPAEWGRERYSTWRTLETLLAGLVEGKRVAMEYSPGDAVPYVDRVPAGVLEMVRSAGATVVSSADLVTRFYAVWSAADLAAHVRAAETIAAVARDAFARAGAAAAAGRPSDEYALQQWILARFEAAGLETIDSPIVAAGANGADPHYGPNPATSARIERGAVLLIDLWAREPGAPFADQTWMGVLGQPSARANEVWAAVRDAREAAVALLQARVAAGEPVRGAEVDDAARRVIEARGFGRYFTHRTGHSIDPRDLHGAGPHIDNFETREDRLLVAGVGFSIEPGVYVPGEIGMRSEVNVHVGDGQVIVTPRDAQRALIVAM
jgi:Xaa-Pro aminopeptidase